MRTKWEVNGTRLCASALTLLKMENKWEEDSAFFSLKIVNKAQKINGVYMRTKWEISSISMRMDSRFTNHDYSAFVLITYLKLIWFSRSIIKCSLFDMRRNPTIRLIAPTSTTSYAPKFLNFNGPNLDRCGSRAHCMYANIDQDLP